MDCHQHIRGADCCYVPVRAQRLESMQPSLSYSAQMSQIVQCSGANPHSASLLWGAHVGNTPGQVAGKGGRTARDARPVQLRALIALPQQRIHVEEVADHAMALLDQDFEVARFGSWTPRRGSFREAGRVPDQACGCVVRARRLPDIVHVAKIRRDYLAQNDLPTMQTFTVYSCSLELASSGLLLHTFFRL